MLALWSVRGVGRAACDRFELWGAGRWSSLLGAPISSWIATAPALSGAAKRGLLSLSTLEGEADRIVAQLKRAGHGVIFRGAAGFPEALSAVPDAPPMLFCLSDESATGPSASTKKRIALVGTRRPEGGFLAFANRLAADLAAQGVVVLSGAAEGIDTACHQGALRAGGETWAFLGSALDTMGPHQRELTSRILDGGGRVFSELPPGARADRTTFPRRNRLISGASDGVVVLRAPEASGALHTARYARAQGRPLFAVPGDVLNECAAGSNALLRDGAAVCLSARDLDGLLGVPRPSERRAATELFDFSPPQMMTSDARAAYEALGQVPRSFDVLLGKSGLPSAALTSALCELELLGRVLRHPGRRYERI